MKPLVCDSCGSKIFLKKDGFWICEYCYTKYLVTKEELSLTCSPSSSAFYNEKKSTNDTNISLSDDIQMLLDKCIKEPHNAKRYANRILDIDPSNADALKILHRR